jgi:hypothetical protein
MSQINKKVYAETFNINYVYLFFYGGNFMSKKLLLTAILISFF